MIELKTEAELYGESLDRFRQENNLPSSLFTEPDHVGIRAEPEELEQAVEVDRTYRLNENGGKLDAARLAGELSIGRFGVEWVELINGSGEHKPGALRYLQFCSQDLETVCSTLRARRVDYRLQPNSGHPFVSMVVNTSGQELRFSAQPLPNVIAYEVEKGNAQFV